MKKYIKKVVKYYKIERILLFGIFITFFVMLLDNFNWCSLIIERVGIVSFSIFIILFLFGVIIYMKVWKWFSIPIINELDSAILSCFFSAFILCSYVLSLMFFEKNHYSLYKMILVTVVFVILICLFFLRKKAIFQDKKAENKYNTYTLQELYQGDIQNNNGIIYLEEEAVDYDLLNRGELIETICNVIRNCNPRIKYVIGLTGAWGQGKTTVINNVKKEISEDKNIVIIDDFDPWNYESKEALFSGMVDAIFQHVGIDYEITKIRTWKKQLETLIFDNSKYIKGLKIFFRQEKETVQSIKESMSDFLGIYDKKIVFVLDNIDRMDDANIMLLFKLVADVLDLNHIVYLLSYDSERITTVLKENKMGDRYLKKVIQMEFDVPPIDKEQKELLFKICLKNLLKCYEVDGDCLNELLNLHPAVINRMNDIRDMKRFFNSVISTSYGTKDRWVRKLNAKDYVIMELMKCENPILYSDILKNAYFFVSHDRIALFGYEYMLDHEKQVFNEKANNYFDKLFETEKNREWLDVLTELFPFVENYNEKKEIMSMGYWSNNEDYVNIIQKARICNGKFFTQYFTLQSNDYMFIKLGVEEIVTLANSSNEKECKDKLLELCEIYQGINQTEIIEVLQIYKDDINEKGWNTLFIILFNQIINFDDSSFFMGLSARERAIYLLSIGLDKMSQEQFDKLLIDIQHQYNNIRILETALYYKRENKDDNVNEPQYIGRAAELYDTLKLMVENVVNNSIDLYCDENYSPYNIWGWYRIARHMESINIKETAFLMIGEKNIYRFLWDMVGKSIGAGYGYTLHEKNINYFTDVEHIEKLLENRIPRTESESFVQEIWEAFKNREHSDDWEWRGDVYVVEERIVKL